MLALSKLSNSLCRMGPRVLLHALHRYLLQNIIGRFYLAVSTMIAKLPNFKFTGHTVMVIWMHKMAGLTTLHEHGMSMYAEKVLNVRVTRFCMFCLLGMWRVSLAHVWCVLIWCGMVCGQAMMKTGLVAWTKCFFEEQTLASTKMAVTLLLLSFCFTLFGLATFCWSQYKTMTHRMLFYCWG